MNDKAAAVVSEEIVLRACNAYDDARDGEDGAEYPAMHAALQAALGVGGWRPIDRSSRSDDLYYYPPFRGLPAVIQVGRTGLCRRATHSMPIPTPPASEEG